MPQLSSGRHVAVSADLLIAACQNGSDEQRSVFIMAYRLNVPTPEALEPRLAVCHFDLTQGTPPNAPCHPSGYVVADVLEGRRDDWTPEEVEEFRTWLRTNPRQKVWLQQQFDAINDAIRNSSVWHSPLWTEI